MPIPVPPENEQKQIARILDAVVNARQRTLKGIEAAKRAKLALVQSVFKKGIDGERTRKTDIGEVPKSWKVVSLDNVVTKCQYGLSMAMDRKGQYPIPRMGAIQEGDVLLDDLKFVDLPKSVAAKYLLQRGDILFNRTNSQELVGKVGVYRSDIQAVFASYLIRVKTDPSQVDNYFLGQMLASYSAQCRIRRYATPGVQQVNVNAKNLKRVKLALPDGDTSLDKQRAIAEILEGQDNVIRKLEALLAASHKLKLGLMQDILTGVVRVEHLSGNVTRDRPMPRLEIPV